MALSLTADEVDALLPFETAVEAVEQACLRIAAGAVSGIPRRSTRGGGARVGSGAALDADAGWATVDGLLDGPDGVHEVTSLFSLEDGGLAAVFAGGLGRIGAAAASAAAARRLARQGAATVGVVGCGRQARLQLAALRAALPSLRGAQAWCPARERLEAFCRETGAEPAPSAQEAGACDVVVTATTSRDPVLRGDWLRPGALVCVAGANEPHRREVDAAVLRRAVFVCCESLEQARLEAGDLVETVAAGVLDWLEVHELAAVVAGEVRGRAADDDVVLFKASGVPAWSIGLGTAALRAARDRGVGRTL